MTENEQPQLAFDSARQYLGSVYAKALLGVTEKRGVTEQVLAELQSFLDDVLGSLPKLEAILVSPRVALEDKLRMLDQAVGGRMQQDLLHFLKVAARHGRLDCLREVARAARQQLNQLRGRIEVQVESAQPLDENLRTAISERLRAALGAEVELHEKINADIVGGLVVRVGDTVYDASVANQLDRLRQSILGGTRQAMRKSTERFASA